jgi:formate dehydrogenase (coenzyme F420) alpha subunit
MPETMVEVPNNNIKQTNTRCGICGKDCPVTVHIKDGKIVAVTPLKKENTQEQSFICEIGIAAPTIINSTDRILSPLKRQNNRFVEISWDEALSIISSKLINYRKDPGPQSVVFHYGVSEVRSGFYRTFMRRFCNVYGTPNYTGCGSQCAISKAMAKYYTIGVCTPDYENCRYMILWGANPATSNIKEWKTKILPAKNRGARLVVIDPRPGEIAEAADQHLKPFPGTDGALALAIARVIIEKGLYDKEFIEKHGFGFDEFRTLVSEYTLEKAEAVTGISSDDIENIAIDYATKGPAVIEVGNGLELHINGVQTIRAIMLLQALTGNIDIKGGVLMPEKGPALKTLEGVSDNVKTMPKGITSEIFPILWAYNKMVNVNRLPETLLTGNPYPVKALMVIGGNPVLTGPNTSHQKEAFKQLDFMVVMDLFMTETAKLADIILPGATCYESDNLKVTNNIYMVPGIIEPVGQAWPAWKLWFELAKKIGYKDEFPWTNLDEAIDEHLSPTGITAADLRKRPEGIELNKKRSYNKYETTGFNTPSGKIDFSSTALKAAGYDALPVFINPHETEVYRGLKNEYPYIMMSGGRIRHFYHSQHRNIPSLLKKSPEPLVEINPEDAMIHGIQDGDPVKIFSKRGAITAKAKYTSGLNRGILAMTHGWSQSNINELTDDELLDSISGFPAYRGFLCNIEKAH